MTIRMHPRIASAHERTAMLVISTGCVDTEGAQWLTDNAYSKGEYGWFQHARIPPEGTDMPYSLRVACGIANAEGCDWIMWDRDAEPHPLLPTFDW